MERFSPRPLPEPLFPARHPAVSITPEVSPVPAPPLADTASPAADSIRPTTYPTGWGSLPFTEIYERTRPYTAYILHHTFFVHEVDDGLQAGYLALYRRLKDEPHLLTDKPLAWIGKFLAYAALHATREDLKSRQRSDPLAALPAAPGGFVLYNPRTNIHSTESRQVDTRIDLLAAIHATAQTLLTHGTAKQRAHNLWALYGMTMLHVCAADVSRMFNVREQSIQAAYSRVRSLLQARLPEYAPHETTTPLHGRGQKILPREDMAAIRNGNRQITGVIYDRVKAQIENLKADTLTQDLLALVGIQQGIPAQTQARANGLPTHRMQRAYDRVHLLLGAQRDPNIRPRRPEKRVKSVFTLTEDTGKAVHELALELLEQPKGYEKLVALHAHISNLAISTTAKHFNLPTSTLRFYARQMGARLGTPTKPAREPFQSE